MKHPIRLCILISIILILMSCSEDKNNPASPTVVATEVWGFIMNDDSTNHGETTFIKKSNGIITQNALWYFGYQNAIVECPFENGTVTIADSIMSIVAQGTANNPVAPPGFQNSSFGINVGGIIRNGRSHGSWSISFSTFGWPALLQGTFTAIRKSGSGITN